MSNHRLLTGSGAPPVSIPATCYRHRPRWVSGVYTRLSTTVPAIPADPPVSRGDQPAGVNDGPEQLPRRSLRLGPPGRSSSRGPSTGTSRSTAFSPGNGLLARNGPQVDAARKVQPAHSGTAASDADRSRAPRKLSAGSLPHYGSPSAIWRLPMTR